MCARGDTGGFAAVAATAILSLVYGIHPALTRSGIAITAAALVVMPLLAWFKRRVAQATSSRALAADAVQSGACAYLAGITLAGLVVNAMFRIGWIDSAAALAALPILIIEGRKAILGESCCCWSERMFPTAIMGIRLAFSELPGETSHRLACFRVVSRRSTPVLRPGVFPSIVFRYMGFMTAKRGTRLSWVSLLGILCIALVLTTGILSVTHTHGNGQINHDCALCFTAHQVVQIAFIVTILLASRPIARFSCERFAPLPRQRFVLKLANRPPPVPAVFA
jgi:hypothetical protein